MSVAVPSLLVFLASQIGTPGPANMVLLGTGARFGFRAALPFVAGVALGKQLIIWPIGFGLMELASHAPGVFAALKWASAGYICWLAWKVANLRLDASRGVSGAPNFLAGLIVHPLNPKAWAMTVTCFTAFVTVGTPALTATMIIAVCSLAIQAVLHPLWAYSGDRIARTVAGTPVERVLMVTLALLTVASVLFVLYAGGSV